MSVRTTCSLCFVVFIFCPLELSSGCVSGRTLSDGNANPARQCYLTTVIGCLLVTTELFQLRRTALVLYSASNSRRLLYSAGSGRNVPCRSARSFINTKNTGTKIST